MKKYFLKLAFVALGVFTLVSCEEDTVTYGGQNFVTFDKVAIKNYPFWEDLGVSDVPVNMAFPVSHDVTIDFTIDNVNAVPGVNYNLLTPQIVIPAGETTGYIKIEVIDNSTLNDSRWFDIKLTAIDDNAIALGINDVASIDKRFLIVNDDCTTTAFDFLGTLKYVTTGLLADPYEGEAEATIDDEGTCNVLLIEGDFSGLSRTQAAPIKFTFAPGTSAVPSLTGSLTADEQLWCEKCYTTEGKTYNILFSATGTYSTSGTNKRIIVNGKINIDGLEGASNLAETTVFTLPAN